MKGDSKGLASEQTCLSKDDQGDDYILFIFLFKAHFNILKTCHRARAQTCESSNRRPAVSEGFIRIALQYLVRLHVCGAV